MSYNMKKNKVYKRIFCIAIMLIISILIAIGTLFIAKDVVGLRGNSEEKKIIIPKNSSAKNIANILYENDIIDSSILFLIYSGITNSYKEYKYGQYSLNSDMPYDIISDIIKNPSKNTEDLSVTFPEGITLDKYGEILENNNIITKNEFIEEVEKIDIYNEFKNQIIKNELIFYKMEGYAFPDTYNFFPGESSKSVVNKIFIKFKNIITVDILKRIEELDMRLDEIITLASIIQNEAGDKSEMKKVSSVFHNRINNKSVFPKLQSDPTKKYVRETISKSIIDTSDNIKNAYDTYKSEGFPPGPISNPGLDAIMAAIYPDETPYYYFCSNLKTREFFYAITLDEQEKNLIKAGLR
ncbi:MAG: endolytic transglycosylase MltG [Oscillospiraceae bacterium]|nr:endolytic transglycosylase MltG [Oscillospiraceae bacterium]